MKPAKGVGAVALVVFAGGLLATASAQVNPFWSSRFGPRLTEQDQRYIVDSTNKLNDSPNPRAGQTLSWTNPNTKAHGTVELTRVYRHNDMTCHAVRYHNMLPRSQTRTYNLNWCKSPDGWRIAS